MALLTTTPTSCNTGSWSQRWSCGWHQPTTTASHAGYVFGEWLIPGLLVLGVVFAVMVVGRNRRGKALFPSRNTVRNPATRNVRDGRVSSGARRA